MLGCPAIQPGGGGARPSDRSSQQLIRGLDSIRWRCRTDQPSATAKADLARIAVIAGAGGARRTCHRRGSDECRDVPRPHSQARTPPRLVLSFINGAPSHHDLRRRLGQRAKCQASPRRLGCYRSPAPRPDDDPGSPASSSRSDGRAVYPQPVPPSSPSAGIRTMVASPREGNSTHETVPDGHRRTVRVRLKLRGPQGRPSSNLGSGTTLYPRRTPQPTRTRSIVAAASSCIVGVTCRVTCFMPSTPRRARPLDAYLQVGGRRPAHPSHVAARTLWT